ncbi:MAG TPA: HIT domain-containing protein [Candidatus Nanoarchaeia archaeon]|nr:HIT domain-containing protein [Candidatus Nanoarchaeia archaeon]
MSQLSKEQLKEIEDYLKTFPENQRKEKEIEIKKQLENQTTQCPFCLMSEGKIETTKIFEDPGFLAVLEINPANRGHTILMSKRHIKSISELNEPETDHLGKIIKKLSTAINLTAEGVNVLYSEGKASGQRFEHFTVNIIPRISKDKVNIEWQPSKIEKQDLEKIKQEIISRIPKEIPKNIPQPLKQDYLKSELMKMKKRLP